MGQIKQSKPPCAVCKGSPPCTDEIGEKGKEINMDRYFYIIEADNLGNKQIRMECNVYGNQGEGYHFNEWVGCILGIAEAQALIKDGEFSCKLCELARYSGDLTEDEANAIHELYFDGISSGEELNITDITYNTPCGCYYFDAEQEKNPERAIA